MSKSTRGLAAVLAATAVGLVAPAAGSAHPSVYTDIAKTVPSPPPPSPFDWSMLDTQTRYVVSNHGNTYVLREENGLTDRGIMDYKKAPGAWREQPSVTTAELFARADTGGQPHATCTGVTELESESAITGWQEVSDAGKPEPFYRYVPFQKVSAGLDDDPAHWIEYVKMLTASLPGGPVDLATVSDDPATAAGQLASLCSGIGGTFVPADPIQTSATSLNGTTIEAATVPLQAEIDQLKADKSALEADKSALRQEADAASTRAQTAEAAAGAAKAKVKSLKRKVKKLRRKLRNAEHG